MWHVRVRVRVRVHASHLQREARAPFEGRETCRLARNPRCPVRLRRRRRTRRAILVPTRPAAAAVHNRRCRRGRRRHCRRRHRRRRSGRRRRALRASDGGALPRGVGTVAAAATARAAGAAAEGGGGGGTWSASLALLPPPASRAPRVPLAVIAALAALALAALAAPRVARTRGVRLKLLQPRLQLRRVERRAGGGARSAARVRSPEELRRALAELAHLQLECAPLVRRQRLQLDPPLVRLWAEDIVRSLRRLGRVRVGVRVTSPRCL